MQGWYTRSRRDSVIAIVSLSPPEERALSARETAERFRELVGDIPDAEEIEVSYTLNDQGAAITWVLRHRDLSACRGNTGMCASCCATPRNCANNSPASTASG